MVDNSQNLSYKVGEAKGQAQVKGSEMMDKVKDTAQSAKESCQNAGQLVQAQAQSAYQAVKDAISMKKNS